MRTLPRRICSCSPFAGSVQSGLSPLAGGVVRVYDRNGKVPPLKTLITFCTDWPGARLSPLMKPTAGASVVMTKLSAGALLCVFDGLLLLPCDPLPVVCPGGAAGAAGAAAGAATGPATGPEETGADGPEG